MLNTNNLARKFAVVTGAVLATLAVGQAPASAASGTVAIYGAQASYRSSSTTTGYRVAGVVSDTAADGYCAKVYLRGRNYVIGYGNVELAGQACGHGTAASYDSRFSLYSDRVYVMVCARYCSGWETAK